MNRLNRFGQLIKDKRGAVTQQHLAEAIDVSQAQLSRWERGKNRPKTARELEKIVSGMEKAGITISKNELLEAWNDQRPKWRPPLLDQEGYLEEQQAYLNYMQKDYTLPPSSIQICFLGDGNLPVIDSETIQEVWVSNLIESVSYRIFWCIDLLPATAFDKLSGALTRIGVKLGRDKLPETCGMIYHYPLFLKAPLLTMPSSRLATTTHYKEFMRAAPTGNGFFPPDDCREIPNDLLGYFQCFGNTVTYLSTARWVKPLTALILNQVCLHFDDPPRSLYLFLDDNRSRTIADSLRIIMNQFGQLTVNR